MSQRARTTIPSAIAGPAAAFAALILVAGCSTSSDPEPADDVADVEVSSPANDPTDDTTSDDTSGDGGANNVDKPDTDAPDDATSENDAVDDSASDDLPEGLPLPAIPAGHAQAFAPDFWIFEYYDGVDDTVYTDLMSDLEAAGYSVTSQTDEVFGTTTDMSNGSEYLVRVDYVNSPPDVTISYSIFTEDFAPSA
ncbi:hypothetical protein [Demequina aurantiaca]|uniref:hypothetical protein n=1 Tax=Demequina aurantiaca TaxID=676200 RepID=UPI0007822E76|nr:hypothetical protein [Demequina aurantiaca]